MFKVKKAAWEELFELHRSIKQKRIQSKLGIVQITITKKYNEKHSFTGAESKFDYIMNKQFIIENCSA